MITSNAVSIPTGKPESFRHSELRKREAALVAVSIPDGLRRSFDAGCRNGTVLDEPVSIPDGLRKSFRPNDIRNLQILRGVSIPDGLG